MVDIAQELEAAGNVTIFSPLNTAFEKLPTKIEDVSITTLRRWILKHFIKGFLYRKEMKNGPVSFFVCLLLLLLLCLYSVENSMGF